VHLVATAHHFSFGFAQLRENVFAALEEDAPVFGEPELSRRAVNELHAQALLEPRQSLADCRWRDAHHDGSARQTLRLSDAGEGVKVEEGVHGRCTAAKPQRKRTTISHGTTGWQVVVGLLLPGHESSARLLMAR
jgi:hypothetical protein